MLPAGEVDREAEQGLAATRGGGQGRARRRVVINQRGQAVEA